MDFNAFSAVLTGEFQGLSPTQLEQFQTLGELYTEWNRKINLISRKDIAELYGHHLLHSIAIATYLSRSHRGMDGCRVLDLGTGGGLPGIPLAILYPSAQFELCDSVGKKVMAAKSIAENIGLKNTSFVNARAETLGASFDFVVSRAVAPLNKLLCWTRGKFTVSLIALKGGMGIPEEIALTARQFHFPQSRVTAWPISNWIEDKYYEGKFVVEMRAK